MEVNGVRQDVVQRVLIDKLSVAMDAQYWRLWLSGFLH